MNNRNCALDKVDVVEVNLDNKKGGAAQSKFMIPCIMPRTLWRAISTGIKMAEIFFQTLLQQAISRGSRSTALQPIIWVMGVFLCGIGISVRYGAPVWLLIALVACIALGLLAFLVAYFYFMFTSPDALRSERYTLSKLAIEKSERGDNIVGVFGKEVARNKIIEPIPESLGDGK